MRQHADMPLGAPPTSATGGRAPRREPRTTDERRSFRRAMWLLFGVLAVLLVIVTITASVSQPTKAEREQAHQDALANPQSISRPDYGKAPDKPGDPGGWEQLALGGLLFVAVGGGGLWLVHSSRKARRARRAT